MLGKTGDACKSGRQVGPRLAAARTAPRPPAARPVVLFGLAGTALAIGQA